MFLTWDDLLKVEDYPNISSRLLPFEDDEGHQSNYHCCQDGAVDWDEFLIQTVVLLALCVRGGGNRGTVYRNLGWNRHWSREVVGGRAVWWRAEGDGDCCKGENGRDFKSTNGLIT